MKGSPLVLTEATQFYSNIHLSIYIPIIKGGIGSFQSRNKVRFCMSLRKIEKKLMDKGIAFIKIRELLKPLEGKVESGIWRRNCAGVAIFYKNGIVKVFSYDVQLPQAEVVAESFFIDPLEKLSPEIYIAITTSLKQLDYNKSDLLVAWQ